MAVPWSSSDMKHYNMEVEIENYEGVEWVYQISLRN